MLCYYQGCKQEAKTKEHIPPKAFFPKDQRNQLLTVQSCELHNNSKSLDDIYVLAQICLNSSPSNRSRDVFMSRIVPQLNYNQDAFKNMLSRDAVALHDGTVRYKVNVKRCDSFFDALSYGITYKACGNTLPMDYSTKHWYHNFQDDAESYEERVYKQKLIDFYSGEPMDLLNFGRVNVLNSTVYSVKVFGIPEFKSSITLVHQFFGVFLVTSMLTKRITHATG